MSTTSPTPIESIPILDHTTPAIDEIRRCLGRHVKIDLDDGRIVVGRFRCTDSASNVVLADAFEIRNLFEVNSDVPTKRTFARRRRAGDHVFARSCLSNWIDYDTRKTYEELFC
jgi:small nuclear ribonucleoprotein (snRNP)-like protein